MSLLGVPSDGASWSGVAGSPATGSGISRQQWNGSAGPVSARLVAPRSGKHGHVTAAKVGAAAERPGKARLVKPRHGRQGIARLAVARCGTSSHLAAAAESRGTPTHGGAAQVKASQQRRPLSSPVQDWLVRASHGIASQE